MIIAGFNSITAVMVLLLGNATGIAASTTNPFSVMVAMDALIDAGKIDSASQGIVFRYITFAIMATAGAIYVTVYAKFAKTKRDAGVVTPQDKADKA